MVSRSPSRAAALLLLLWSTSGFANSPPLPAEGAGERRSGLQGTVAPPTIVHARADVLGGQVAPGPGETDVSGTPRDRAVPDRQPDAAGVGDSEAGLQQEASADPGDPLPTYELPEVQIEVLGDRPSPEQIRSREPTGAVSVVAVEARAGRAPDTAALLATVPGVHLQQLGGFGQAQSISLRGASSSGVLVMLDGIPLNGAGGISDLSRLPTAWLSRIEVLRGGGGAAYGSGALGGAVNLVTRGLSDEPSLALELGAGSFGAFHGLADFAGPVLGGEALLLLHGSTSRGDFPYLHDDTPGHDDPLVERLRLNNDAHLVGGLLRFRRSLGKDLELSALGELSFDERGVAGAALNVTPNRRDAHRRLTAAVRLDHAPAAGPTLNARAWVRSDDATITGFAAANGPQTYQTGAVEVSSAHALHPAHRLMLEVGVGGERFRAGFSESSPNRLRGHLSLKDTWIPFEGLILIPAVRIEQVGDQTLLAPKVGAELRLGRHLAARANVGQSHRAPSFLELYVVQPGLAPNPALLPERGLSADLGVVLETGIVEATLTAYYGLYENLITYEFYPPNLPRPYNVPGADVGGTEATVRFTPWRFLTAEAGWTWMRTRNLLDDVRYHLKALPYRPEHRGHVRVEAGPEPLRVHATLEAQAAQFASRDHRSVIPARALVHSGLTWRAGPSAFPLELVFEARNLTDARVHDLAGYPLPPRSFHLSLRARTGVGGGAGANR